VLRPNYWILTNIGYKYAIWTDAGEERNSFKNVKTEYTKKRCY